MNYYGGFTPQYGGSYQPNQGMYGNPRMDFLQQTQQSMQPAPQGMQTGELQGRVVTCKEEAVAAQVMPGAPYFFLDLSHGRAYVKRVDPQTGAADFLDLAVVRPEAVAQPQYATVDMINEIRAELDKLRAEAQKGAELA